MEKSKKSILIILMMALVITIIPTNIGIITGDSVADAASKPYYSRQIFDPMDDNGEIEVPERFKIGGKYFWIEATNKNRLYCADTKTSKGHLLISGTEDELLQSKIICNGSTVYFTKMNENDSREYLYKASTDGKNRKKIYKFSYGAMPVGVRGSYLYMVDPRNDGGFNLVKMSLSSKKKTTLVRNIETAGEALGCKYIYYYDRTKSKHPLTRYDISTGKKVTLNKYIDEWRVYPEDPTHLYYVRLAPDATVNGNKRYAPSLWRSSLTGKNPEKLRDLTKNKGYKFMDGVNFCHSRQKLYEDHAVWTHYIIDMRTLDVYSKTEESYDNLYYEYWLMMQEDGETPKHDLYYEGTIEITQ